MSIIYWSYIGTIYLIILTVQDYRNNMRVDDRRNYFMMGVTISLISHVYTPLWYKLGLILSLVIFYSMLKKSKAIGDADINTLSWIFTGYGLLNLYFIIWFGIIFAIITIIYTLIKKYLFKISQAMPFYAVILLIFIVFNILFGLY